MFFDDSSGSRDKPVMSEIVRRKYGPTEPSEDGVDIATCGVAQLPGDEGTIGITRDGSTEWGCADISEPIDETGMQGSWSISLDLAEGIDRLGDQQVSMDGAFPLRFYLGFVGVDMPCAKLLEALDRRRAVAEERQKMPIALSMLFNRADSSEWSLRTGQPSVRSMSAVPP
jgi:hypothetical protein